MYFNNEKIIHGIRKIKQHHLSSFTANKIIIYFKLTVNIYKYKSS